MMTHRCAFTLLETMMALVVGGIIVLAMTGVLSSIDGMDSRMQVRFASSSDLARTRTVVARAMDALLMSAEPQRAVGGNAEDRPPARFLLADEDPAASRAVRTARMSGQMGVESPQRLEVVLSRWPVPREVIEEQRARLGERADSVPPPGLGGVIRCAFELRPERDGTWTLWWRALPLPEHGGAIARDTDPTEDPGAVALVSGLTKCRWTAFDDRERKSKLSAAWATELPAYVELEIATNRGASANWMFEVGWSNGTETADEAGPETSATGEDETQEPATRTGSPRGGRPRGPVRSQPTRGRGGRGGFDG